MPRRHTACPFITAGKECERWSPIVTLPLESQLRDHKAQLKERCDGLTRISQNAGSVQERLYSLKKSTRCCREREMIDRLLSRVKLPGPEARAA